MPIAKPACQGPAQHLDLFGRTDLDCFGWDAQGKKAFLKSPADFPKNGQAVLEAFNAAILAQNSKRKAKHGAKAKLLPLLDSKCEKPFFTLFDATLFEGWSEAGPTGSIHWDVQLT